MTPRSVGDVAVEMAPWLERLARVGYAAKGVLYLTIGVAAARAGLGTGGKTGSDTHVAMAELFGTALGRPLLVVIALGLTGYAVWQLAAAIKNPEHHGSGKRLASLGRGLVHLALAGTAISFVVRHRGHGSEDASARHWTARALDMPGGTWLVWAIAAVIAGYSLFELYKVWNAKLDAELELGRLGASTRRAVIAVSRFGLAARAIVFGTVAVLLARAARSGSSGEAGAMADSMRELVLLGRWPYLAIACGLVAYGVYQLICAAYCRIKVS
ncbi:MAG: DUF1206 domain-containing protein [Kofleriaceae bacterium]